MKQRREWLSFQQSRRGLVVLLMPLLLLLLADQAFAGNKARGIDPKDLSYFQDDNIWCKDGSKSFPRGRLNDNFCDCADGTDEPGTSACPASKYYCRNSGSAPKLVFASRVNDGICDCCDGSDEYEKRVNCVNTCGRAVKESGEKLKEVFGQAATLDTKDVSETIPHHQQKNIGEDLVSKLKGVTQNLFSCWKSNYHNKIICMWLPLFSLLFLLAWMWARVPRRLQLRRKKVSRHSLV